MNTYWEGNGKYQEFVNSIKGSPRGYTNNPYLNLYHIACNLYYDVYNNNGGNITQCYLEDIKKYGMRKINRNIFRITQVEKMEKAMDKIFKFLLDKDLSYEKAYLIRDKSKRTYSTNLTEGLRALLGDNNTFDNDIIRIEVWGCLEEARDFKKYECYYYKYIKEWEV